MLHPERARVLSLAAEWLGTPFHDNAGIKGVGCDCAHFLSGVFQEAGYAPDMVIEHYSPQFMLHSDEEKFAGYVLRYTREIAEPEVQPGDVVLYRIGRSYAHGSIVVGWPLVIHAYQPEGIVVESDVSLPSPLSENKNRRFFSPWRH